MSFVSYAPNFEDVMLWRALQSVARGFYIDMGANAGTDQSITRAFYERGWQGINSPRHATHHQQLLLERPRDKNLRPQEAAATLATIWHAHVPNEQDVHFVVLDACGADDAETPSTDCGQWGDWDNCRPWIVVIAVNAATATVATTPPEPAPLKRPHGWELQLKAAQYQLAYTDGLNRYYVALERSALLSAFQFPPNSLDNFVPSSVRVAQAVATEANARAIKAENRAAAATAQWVLMQSSTSWRWTAPLRRLVIRLQALRAWLNATAKPNTIKALEAVGAAGLVNRARLLRRRMLGLNGIGGSETGATITFEQLTPQARRIYQHLKAAGNTPDGQAQKSLAPGSAGRLKLAYVSPLPPEHSGIADYSAELLPELARFYDLDVVLAQKTCTDPWVAQHCGVRSTEWLLANAQRYDRVLYHFGNSSCHQHMFELLERVPGVVVLHDFFLGDVQLQRALQSDGTNPFNTALYTAHGYGALQAHFRQYQDIGVQYQYPVNLAVLRQAQGIISHSEYARTLASQWYGAHLIAQWCVIPLLRVPTAPAGRAATRAQLGLHADDFVIGTFGLLGPTKLNHRLLSAWLHSSLAHNARCVLLFIGENDGADYGNTMLQTIASSHAASRIHITGWVDKERYNAYLDCIDVGVQLRSQSRGETSAAVLDCMGHGLPTIVNASGAMAELPSDAVKTLPEAFEESQLVDALECLWRNPPLRATLGQQARAHVAAHHAPSQCAQQYAQAIEQFHAHAQEDLQRMNAAPQSLSSTAPTETQYLSLAQSIAHQQWAGKATRQLWVDVSATCRNDLKTGIQRVVRALVLELIQSPPQGCRVEPVYLAESGGLHYRYARQWTLGALGLPTDCVPDEPADYAANDLLLVADYTGDYTPRAERAGIFEQLRLAGVSIHFVVYDLLPIQLPEVFPPSLHGFGQWLDAVARVADGVVCISRTVADDVRTWMDTSGVQRAKPLQIGWFHLGADVENSAPSYGLPADAKPTLQRMAAAPSFLMVGTIEPRKGYAQTLEAFSLLWKQGVDINLVIVGPEGWKGMPDDQRRDIPHTVQRLRSHPERGARLFWLEGISDEYLDAVYAASTCLIAASSGEGFGLPLIEAARRKVPILARDIAVFREVAGAYANYFQADTPMQLAHAITQWLALEKDRATPPMLGTFTWKNSAAQLIQVVCHNNWYTKAPQ